MKYKTRYVQIEAELNPRGFMEFRTRDQSIHEFGPMSFDELFVVIPEHTEGAMAPPSVPYEVHDEEVTMLRRELARERIVSSAKSQVVDFVKQILKPGECSDAQIVTVLREMLLKP